MRTTVLLTMCVLTPFYRLDFQSPDPTRMNERRVDSDVKPRISYQFPTSGVVIFVLIDGVLN